MSAQHRQTYMFIIFLSTLLQWQYSSATWLSNLLMLKSRNSSIDTIIKSTPKVIKKGCTCLNSPSWFGPAVQYASYIAGAGIAGYVVYNHYYSWRYPLMKYLEKNEKIPQNVINTCDNRNKKNMLNTYNRQYELNKDQNNLGRILNHCKSTIQQTFYGL